MPAAAGEIPFRGRRTRERADLLRPQHALASECLAPSHGAGGLLPTASIHSVTTTIPHSHVSPVTGCTAEPATAERWNADRCAKRSTSLSSECDAAAHARVPGRRRRPVASAAYVVASSHQPSDVLGTRPPDPVVVRRYGFLVGPAFRLVGRGCPRRLVASQAVKSEPREGELRRPRSEGGDLQDACRCRLRNAVTGGGGDRRPSNRRSSQILERCRVDRRAPAWPRLKWVTQP
ncbi:MAG: hypothetical protein QOJ52_3151 [Acidimicrobiaceae bacterium]|nr:hypothetical protein [Acidimicrobiaceae bacterium]